MANYNVIITGGQSSQAMQKGLYDVSTLEPKVYNATEDEGS